MKPKQFRAAIEETAGRIAPYIRRTPTVNLAAEEMGLAFPVTLKLECLQHTGSFKTRGAFNKLLSNEVPASGVNAASGGNHGLSLIHI